MGGCIDETGVGISRFVMDYCGKDSSVYLDCDIQEINRCGRYFRNEFNRWMVVTKKVNEVFKLNSGHISYTYYIINVSPVRFRKITLIFSPDQVLQMTCEKAHS